MSHVFNMVGEISSAKLVSIKVTTPPSKTSYAAGEYFSTAGMVVEATYSNGVSATIAGYTYSPSGPLSENSTSITIQYTEGGITVTTTQSITIKKAPVATFANNDWDTIIEACQNNNVPNTWVVGNSKTMTINGRSYQIDIIGKNHDTYASGGTAPLTFQMHELYRTKYKMTSSYDATNSWKGSEMRVTHLPEIKALMPSVVKNAIRTVLKPTADDGWTPVIENVEDDLFLLSEIEVFGSCTYSCSGEGIQYAYYAAGNNPKKSSDQWWTRSPVYDSEQGFITVAYNWEGPITQVQTESLGVAFAFCF